MNKLYFFLPIFFLIGNSIQGQINNPYDLPIDSSTGLITYTRIEQFERLSKQEINSRCKLWVAKFFRSAKATIDMDDPTAGILIMSSTFDEPKDAEIVKNQYCNFKLSLIIKDFKCKMAISNITQNVEFANGTKSGPNPIESMLLFNPTDPKNEKYVGYRKGRAKYITTKTSEIFQSIIDYIRTNPDNF